MIDERVSLLEFESGLWVVQVLFSMIFSTSTKQVQINEPIGQEDDGDEEQVDFKDLRKESLISIKIEIR